MFRILIVLLVATPAYARDNGEYDHVDERLRAWFKKLRSPATGAICCDPSDCKRTEADTVGDHHRARLPSGEWVDIPPELVIHDSGNPTGEPVLCALPSVGGSRARILCFVPGAGL
ncbi:hypothetical protein [Rhodoplanes roseus]|uniref:hypothetical protein n=1 Tax=Rhodoplanes roseus TaxID=29409 RepID=UPI0011B7EE54|nr:hypothetical protein [Rhodoplanes roseus]